MTTPSPTGREADPPPITPAQTFLLALSCGIIVANIYYVQPLVGLISRDYGMGLASAGLLVTVTQLGYAAGLLLIVPLGDAVENRRLITGLLGVLVAVLLATAAAPNAALFLLGSACVGLCASSVQIIVPLAGHLAPDAARGRVLGSVVSGLLFGIMLSRPMASFIAHFLGHSSVFLLSAGACATLLAVLLRALPERRPTAALPYLGALASLGPLLLRTAALRHRSFIQAMLFAAFSLFWTAVPLLLEGPRFGFNQIGIGLFALAGAAGAVVSPLAGRAADAGRSAQITVAALGGAMLAFVLALAGGPLRSPPLLVVAALLLDMAIAAHLVVGQREILAVAAAARGRLNGLYLAIFFVGGSLGSLASGYLYAAGGWTAVSLAGFGCPALALLFYALAPRPRG